MKKQAGNYEVIRKKLVRQRGLEPPRYCYRQPLKLVRLPIPPLPHKDAKFILAAVNVARNRIKKRKATSSGSAEAVPELVAAAVASLAPMNSAQGSEPV